MNLPRSVLGSLLAAGSIFCVSLGANARVTQKTAGEALPAASQEKLTKLAQGEYVVLQGANGGAVGPFGEEVYNFHETWTLWRITSGGYQVEGERRFESPKGTAHSNRFVARLSRDLTIDRVTEFAPLKWRPDSGPLSCNFSQKELHCSSDAKDPRQSIDAKLAVKEPFGLLWPISVFSLSGITREAERDPNHATHVQLVSFEQPSREVPVSPTILDGELRYAGEEPIDVAGEQQRAFKFFLKVALHPQLTIWTSRQGLLLALEVDHAEQGWPEESIKLLQFHQWAQF
jgi:hypothetical protein